MFLHDGAKAVISAAVRAGHIQFRRAAMSMGNSYQDNLAAAAGSPTSRRSAHCVTKSILAMLR
jgi:hypothetical protein